MGVLIPDLLPHLGEKICQQRGGHNVLPRTAQEVEAVSVPEEKQNKDSFVQVDQELAVLNPTMSDIQVLTW